MLVRRKVGEERQWTQADSTAQAEAKAKVRRTSVAETGNPHSSKFDYIHGRPWTGWYM
jgi:hypothetical protein